MKNARTKALLAWCDAVIYDITDLAKVRAARAAFEKINGPQQIGDLCGNYVHGVPDDMPVGTVSGIAPVLLKEGRHHVLRPSVANPVVKRKEPEKVAFGSRLRAARVQAGIPTIVKLAAVAEIPLTTLNTVEAGHRIPADRVVNKLATVLGVSVEWLRTGQGKPFRKAA